MNPKTPKNWREKSARSRAMESLESVWAQRQRKSPKNTPGKAMPRCYATFWPRPPGARPAGVSSARRGSLLHLSENRLARGLEREAQRVFGNGCEERADHPAEAGRNISRE